MTKVSLLLLTIIGLLANACSKDVAYPLTPVLSNPQFTIDKIAANDSTATQTIVKLTCSFTDGDGDIGLTSADTLPPNNVNFFIDYYEKIDGAFSKVTAANSITDTVNFNSRVPLLNSDGSKKSISGDISIDINVTASSSDTIAFQYYLVDRALNKSNSLNSGPIILSKK